MAAVVIELIPWAGDSRAEPKDAFCLVSGQIVEIDGVLVLERRAKIEVDGFVTVTVDDPPDELVAKYGPRDYLDGTVAGRLVLPVTDLVVNPG